MIRAAWLAARPLWQVAPAAVALGWFAALGQAPYDWPVVMLVALFAVFVLYRGAARAKRAALVGWLFGFGYFFVTLGWITEPFQVDAARHGWMAPFALVLLAGGLALFWALAFGVARRLRAGVFGLAVAWPLSELLRAYVFTGFPWAMLSQGMLETPVAAGLAWGGPHGVMLFLCLGAAVLVHFSDRPLLVLGPALLALASVAMPPKIAAPQMGPHTVRLVQPNAPQHEKWDPEKIPVFVNRQLMATAAPAPVQPDLIVWPETALPYLQEYAQPVFDQIADAARGAPVVLGIQRRVDEQYYNGLVVLNAAGQVAQSYDKHHLVPFGEYFPLADLARRIGLVGLAEINGAGYARGPGPQVLNLGDLGGALPLICYEAVFAHDVGAAPVRPDLLLQVTNDAWFGQFAGPQQHLAQARMRAIEQGLPMARAANTGISAMIGPRGTVLDSLPLGVSGHVDAALPLPLPPTLYARMGDMPVALVLLAAFGLLVWRRILIDGAGRPA